MIITAIRTERVSPRSTNLHDLIRTSLEDFPAGAVLAVSSKIVSLCEGRVVSAERITKEELVRQQADLYLPSDFGNRSYRYTVTRNTLIGSAGIDESNIGGGYVLWPADPQRTANELRAWLRETYGVRQAGVIITDSTSMPPLRRGAIGLLLAHSGFRALQDNRGKADLFGRELHVSVASVGSGLAAAMNLVMGEATEQTPLALASGLPFVDFQDDDPSAEELAEVYIPVEDDIYAPFLLSAPWQKGGGRTAAGAAG